MRPAHPGCDAAAPGSSSGGGDRWHRQLERLPAETCELHRLKPFNLDETRDVIEHFNTVRAAIGSRSCCGPFCFVSWDFAFMLIVLPCAP